MADSEHGDEGWDIDDGSAYLFAWAISPATVFTTRLSSESLRADCSQGYACVELEFIGPFVPISYPHVSLLYSGVFGSAEISICREILAEREEQLSFQLERWSYKSWNFLLSSGPLLELCDELAIVLGDEPRSRRVPLHITWN